LRAGAHSLFQTRIGSHYRVDRDFRGCEFPTIGEESEAVDVVKVGVEEFADDGGFRKALGHHLPSRFLSCQLVYEEAGYAGAGQEEQHLLFRDAVHPYTHVLVVCWQNWELAHVLRGRAFVPPGDGHPQPSRLLHQPALYFTDQVDGPLVPRDFFERIEISAPRDLRTIFPQLPSGVTHAFEKANGHVERSVGVREPPQELGV
jgi:hypothetical protein